MASIRFGERVPTPREIGRKEEGKIQYLLTMDFVDPGPLLPPQQLAGMMRQAVLPGHEALLNLKSEGKILAGGIPVGERAIAFIVEADSHKELDALLQEIPFWGIDKTNSLCWSWSLP
jgi:hypothetical protein